MEYSEYVVLVCIGIGAALLGAVLLFVEVTAYGLVASRLGTLVAVSGIVGAFWKSQYSPPRRPQVLSDFTAAIS